MANNTLVLCKPLCFLVTKLGKLELKVIKSALLYYYSSAEITVAKTQLMDDITNLQLNEKTPYTAQRRDGENRSIIEIDIIKLIGSLDELKQLDKLPRYVIDDPDSMPSIRSFEVDLSHIITRMERIENRLENRITGLSSPMAAIALDMSVINNDLNKLVTANCEWPPIGIQRQASRPITISQNTMVKPAYAAVVGEVGGTSSNHASGNDAGYKQKPKQSSDSIVSSNFNLNWAASSSTPLGKLERRSRSRSSTGKQQTGTDSESTDQQSDNMCDGGPYTSNVHVKSDVEASNTTKVVSLRRSLVKDLLSTVYHHPVNKLEVVLRLLKSLLL